MVSKDTDEYKNRYPDLDVDKSLAKLKKHNPKYGGDDMARWLAKDLAKGWNIKQPSYKQFDSGNIRAYCSKCGSSDTLGGIQGTRGLTLCCGAEYQPEPMAKKAND